jgi:glycosyltransferase involved in cell wall biosynthesis
MKRKPMATIDVILPVRNGMPYVKEAMDSIYNQTFSDWRLIVLDHGSTDLSLETARQYEETDERIEVHSCPDADSIGSLRNIGLGLCDCRYVLLQDADDVSLPDRMEKILGAFSHAPDLLAVGGEAIIIDPQGKERGYLPVLAKPAAISAATMFHFPMIHPASALNFAAIGRHGAAYGRDFLHCVPNSDSLTVNKLAEDYIMFGQLALVGKCANLNEPLIKYRRHPGSVGIGNRTGQIDAALAISRFLAKSFCYMRGVRPFDPTPFCNHADYVFDYYQKDYSKQFSALADALRCGMGPSAELDRELAFRRVMATRKFSTMAYRFLRFRSQYGALPNERRTVRNWFLKNVRHDKYVYYPDQQALGNLSYAG